MIELFVRQRNNGNTHLVLKLIDQGLNRYKKHLQTNLLYSNGPSVLYYILLKNYTIDMKKPTQLSTLVVNFIYMQYYFVYPIRTIFLHRG